MSGSEAASFYIQPGAIDTSKCCVKAEIFHQFWVVPYLQRCKDLGGKCLVNFVIIEVLKFEARFFQHSRRCIHWGEKQILSVFQVLYSGNLDMRNVCQYREAMLTGPVFT